MVSAICVDLVSDTRFPFGIRPVSGGSGSGRQLLRWVFHENLRVDVDDQLIRLDDQSFHGDADGFRHFSSSIVARLTRVS